MTNKLLMQAECVTFMSNEVLDESKDESKVADKQKQARLLDEMAETLRKEGAKHKDMTKRNVLFGVAAGLEVAACALRDSVLTIPETDAAQILARYRATRIDYLLDAAPSALPHKRPPKLMVSRVVTGLGKERKEGKKQK